MAGSGPTNLRKRPMTDKAIGDSLLQEAVRRGLLAPSAVAKSQKDQAEWDRCASDPCYFISHYVYTYDPRVLPADPYMLLKLWPRQEEFIGWLVERVRTGTDGMVEKSRDSGVSCCVLAAFLWFWLFTPGFSAGVGSYKLEKVDKKGDPDSLFEKLRIMVRRLPPWMMPAGWDETTCAPECRFLNPENQSMITGEGGEKIGRGGRKTAYLIDEAAHLENQESADAALRDTTRVRIYVSTPNGLDAFYRKRTRMPRFTFHWKDDPRKNRWVLNTIPTPKGGGQPAHDSVERTATLPLKGVGAIDNSLTEGDNSIRELSTRRGPSGPDHVAVTQPVQREGHGPDAPEGAIYPWYENEKRRSEPDELAQEVDISYLGTGHPRFDREYLNAVLEELLAHPRACRVEEEPWAAKVTTYQDPQFGVQYAIVADVAEGVSATGEADWSVAHVYRTDDWTQVCHYRGRPDTHEYGVDLATLGMQYAERGLPALLCVLRKGPGIAVLEYLMNQHDQGAGYPNLYVYAGIIGGQPQTRPGFPESAPSNIAAEEELAAILRGMADGEPGFTWNNANTIEELMHVVRKPGGRGAAAEFGYNDDEYAVCRAAAVLLPTVTTRRKLSMGPPPPPRNVYAVGGRTRR